MLEAAEDFRGVPHRLELVRELHGVRWYNNSIATAPERTHGSDPCLRRADRAAARRARQEPSLGGVDATRQRACRSRGALRRGGGKDPENGRTALGWPEKRFTVARADGLHEAVHQGGGSGTRQAMSFCYRRAARVSMSSRILRNVEKGLENGYRNFRKQSLVLFARQETWRAAWICRWC